MFSFSHVPTAIRHPIDSLHHDHTLAWHAITGALISAVMITEAQADENVLGHFTSSLSKVYVATEMCEGTLSYSPSNFLDTVRQYLAQYYPQGVGYWVLPAASEHIENVDRCVVMMEARLFDYNAASVDFRTDYPDAPVPPVLRVMLTGHKYTEQRQAALPSVPAYRPANNARNVYTGVGP